MASLSSLHYTILHYIINSGYAPSRFQIAKLLNKSISDVEKDLQALADYHGVVLHPHVPEIWVIHPFSLAPTNFYVQSKRGEWWGNCAWCSLGIAALLQEDVKITTTIGAQTEQIEINIIDGEVKEKDYFIHFPIPMTNAWDNVIYTCSNMLIFRNNEEVSIWCSRHNIPKGDLQPIDRIWQFSQKWYGNHLNPEWTKWTQAEAQQMFTEYGLNGPVWQLGNSEDRF